METSKKQIKKELKKTLNLVSKLKKSKLKNDQDTLNNLYNEVNETMNFVKMMLGKNSEKEVQKDLETL
jgi:hypothetical protein